MSTTDPAPRPPLGGTQALLRVLLAALGIVVAVVGLAVPTASAGASTGTQNSVAAINPETAPAVEPGAAVSPGSVGVPGPVFDDGAVVSLVTPRPAAGGRSMSWPVARSSRSMPGRLHLSQVSRM